MDPYEPSSEPTENFEPIILVELPKVTYRCGACEKLTDLNRKVPLICGNCGRNILFKVRNKNHVLVYDGR